VKISGAGPFIGRSEVVCVIAARRGDLVELSMAAGDVNDDEMEEVGNGEPEGEEEIEQGV
jgi:hypothetical protein